MFNFLNKNLVLENQSVTDLVKKRFKLELHI
jgi:hypothetical protein